MQTLNIMSKGMCMACASVVTWLCEKENIQKGRCSMARHVMGMTGITGTKTWPET